MGNWELGNWELGIGNCVKSGYTIIAKPENHLAAAGIAFLHCILLAIKREISVNYIMPDAPCSIA